MRYLLSENVLRYASLKEIAMAVTFCIALISCGQVSMEDVSLNPTYSRVIGKKITVKEDLWALGITTDQNYKKRIDYIVLVPGVGFSGPEVITRDRLNSGSIVKISRVLKARSPVFSRVDYVVKEVDTSNFSGNEVRISLSGDINDQNYGLDESIYSVESGQEW